MTPTRRRARPRAPSPQGSTRRGLRLVLPGRALPEALIERDVLQGLAVGRDREVRGDRGVEPLGPPGDDRAEDSLAYERRREDLLGIVGARSPRQLWLPAAGR